MSTETTLVNIITVVKDDPKGLLETAESLLKQNSTQFEWLIVDGSAGDECMQLVGQLEADFRIHYLRQTASGIYSAMNFGIEHASESFIWFVNAGDILLGPSAVRVLNRILEKQSSHTLIAFTVLHLSSRNYFHSATLPNVLESEGTAIGLINHQGFIASKEVLTSLGKFDTSLKIAADSKLIDAAVSKYPLQIYPLAILGFELGGASGQNFSIALKELAIFRPTAFLEKNPNRLIIKNKIRMIYIRLQTNSFFFLFTKYFAQRREAELLHKLSQTGITLVSD